MKNVTEWSVEFDLLYNNIMSNQAPGLNAYEKSVILTRAQNNTVLQLYNGSVRESFEGSEELTSYLSQLVSQGNGTLDTDEQRIHIIPSSSVFKLPSDALFKTYESCVLYADASHQKEFKAVVVPVSQDEFWRIHSDPFKRENERRVLSLSYSDGTIDNGLLAENRYSELISKYEIKSYSIRYIKKPSPIILEDLTNTGLSIDGETSVSTCMLPEVLHHTILVEAVRLAKAAWSSNNQ